MICRCFPLLHFHHTSWIRTSLPYTPSPRPPDEGHNGRLLSIRVTVHSSKHSAIQLPLCQRPCFVIRFRPKQRGVRCGNTRFDKGYNSCPKRVSSTNPLFHRTRGFLDQFCGLPSACSLHPRPFPETRPFPLFLHVSPTPKGPSTGPSLPLGTPLDAMDTDDQWQDYSGEESPVS